MSPGANRVDGGCRSERDRIALIKAGDRAEIGLLFEEMAKEMLTALRARWPDQPTVVQDAVQHAFLRLIEDPLSIRAETIGELRRWLYTVAMNHLKDYVKSAESKRAIPLSSLAVGSEGDQQDEEYFERVPDPGISVEEMVEYEDTVRSVWHLISALHNDCPEILEMFYGEGLTLAQIAQRLDTTVDKIKKRKGECVAALVELVKETGLLPE